MKRYLILLYSFLPAGFLFSQKIPVEVKHAGALRNIMQQGSTEAVVSLDSLDLNHLYGLGAVAGLKGEIIILNGKSYRGFVDKNELSKKSDYNGAATLLVYASVSDWKTIEIHQKFNSLNELESIVENAAREQGLDTNQPFPFLLEGTYSSLSWHVINWPEEDKVHTHEKHRASGLNGTLVDEKTMILGFYSVNHKGVFTHHSTNVHMHAMVTALSIPAHIDELQSESSLVLYLPLQ